MIELVLPKGRYLLFGYVCFDGTSTNGAWLNNKTDPNDSTYSFLKILNYCSFVKIVETSKDDSSYALYNLNGTTITTHSNMYLGAILLKEV